jgi:hypothetical protein
MLNKAHSLLSACTKLTQYGRRCDVPLGIVYGDGYGASGVNVEDKYVYQIDDVYGVKKG